MENQEETEMMQDFGGILRAVMGSAMQMAEHAQRRAQMRLAEANALAERERNAAQLVNRDLSSPQFWKTAGSEAIADRMTVASELAGRHELASQAFMNGADRIRNLFGINVEDINRDHPTAAIDRHRALRDALDDYLAGQRANAEGNPLGADKARENEDAQEATAERAGGEERLDTANAEVAEEKAESTSAHDPTEAKDASGQETESGVETRAAKQSAEVPAGTTQEQHSAAAQRLLTVWKGKGGKDADFPLAPTTANPQTAMKNRKRVMAGASPSRTQGQEISR